MTTVSNAAALPHMLLAADCVPSNDLISGPLNKPFTLLIGAVGGVVPDIVIGGIIVGLVLALIFVFRGEGSRHIKTIAAIGAIPLIVILIILVALTVYKALNTIC